MFVLCGAKLRQEANSLASHSPVFPVGPVFPAGIEDLEMMMHLPSNAVLIGDLG